MVLYSPTKRKIPFIIPGNTSGWDDVSLVSFYVHLFSAVCGFGVEIKITGRMETGRLSAA